MCMNKLLVSIYVVRLDEEYDLNIPIGIKVSDAIKIIIKTIKDLRGDDYSTSGSENLYRYDGYLINVNNLVKFSGITNGMKLMLL